MNTVITMHLGFILLNKEVLSYKVPPAFDLV